MDKRKRIFDQAISKKVFWPLAWWEAKIKSSEYLSMSPI